MAGIQRQRELTTQEAADLLGISRMSLMRLLDDGAISSDGTRRRIKVEAVLAYRDARSRQRERALRELTAISEDIGYW